MTGERDSGEFGESRVVSDGAAVVLSDGEVVLPLAEHLFRHESGRLRAWLVRMLGARRLDLADDIVQETLLAALHHWRFRGVPENPAAWLNTVARRKAIDVVRSDRRRADSAADVAAWAADREETNASRRRAEREDPIRLMFLCAHPVLSAQDRVLLTLSLVAGFGVCELARAFLISVAAAEQRLVRAKRTVRDADCSFDLPDEPAGGSLASDGLRDRLRSVLWSVYLMLNEGYTAHSGDRLVRCELLDEARRWLGLLGESGFVSEDEVAEVHALTALACFVSARASARTDVAGALVLMKDQDRGDWDRALLGEGFWHLARSTCGERLTVYGIEAGISGCHAAAPTFEQTDWSAIVDLYVLLERLKPTPVVALNKAAAIAMRDGPEAGLAALEGIPVGKLGERYYLVEAVRGEILRLAGRREEAGRAFRLALSLPCSEPERALLRERLELVEGWCGGGGVDSF